MELVCQCFTLQCWMFRTTGKRRNETNV